jgi:hypothetical protein
MNPKLLLGRLIHTRPVYPARGFTRATRPTSARGPRPWPARAPSRARADRRGPLVRGTWSRGASVLTKLAAGGSAGEAETIVVLSM